MLFMGCNSPHLRLELCFVMEILLALMRDEITGELQTSKKIHFCCLSCGSFACIPSLETREENRG